MSARAEAPGRVLEASRPLRLFTIFILYVAQGVPIGLFWFAIPAWMTVNGAGAADVAWVLGLTALPWSLKFLNGFVMDRYAFLPMGRRRGWILAAQSVMVLVFLVAAVIRPGPDDLMMLGALGFLGNLATTFQDVGVDGMAVDLLEESERARGGGMMFGGQLIGTALATAGTGWAISAFGAAGAYLVAAAVILAVSGYLMTVRERHGERRMPWSAGATHPVNEARHSDRWWPILRTTLRSLLRPVSLLWVPVRLTNGMIYGVMAGLTPLIGSGQAGMSETQVTSLTGLAQLIAGLVGLSLGGWIGDRFGAKWSSIALFTAWVLFFSGMILCQPLWSEPRFAIAIILTWFVLDTLLVIVTVPISMRLCDLRVSAAQFAIYMAVSNFGITLGATLLGFSERLGGLVSLFPILIACNLIAITILLLVRFPRRASIGQ